MEVQRAPEDRPIRECTGPELLVELATRYPCGIACLVVPDGEWNGNVASLVTPFVWGQFYACIGLAEFLRQHCAQLVVRGSQ